MVKIQIRQETSSERKGKSSIFQKRVLVILSAADLTSPEIAKRYPTKDVNAVRHAIKFLQRRKYVTPCAVPKRKNPATGWNNTVWETISP